VIKIQKKLTSRRLKKSLAARFGVENRLETLTYCRVRSAFESVFALHRIHQRLFQQPASFRLLAVLLPLTAILPRATLADTELTVVQSVEEQADVYFADSGRERTPAITAFPHYPRIARRDRVEGETTVCFTVNARGQVIRPGIRDSTHRVFERPALDAIRASTFEPLKSGESKSNLKTCRIYRFKLAAVDESNNEF
jgi:protein TonB